METELIVCDICGKEYSKKGIGTHIWRSHGEGITHNSNRGYTCGRIPWNKGLTKETSESVKRYSEKNKNHKTWLGKKHSDDTILKMKSNPNCGGYRKGSGRGKSGWYQGYWCDSSWELAYTIYNIENDIVFDRNILSFPYEFNGEIKMYIPDYIVDGVFVEIKGQKTTQWEEKRKQFPHHLIVLYKDDMNKYISYVENKYGKNYIELYDGYTKPIKNKTSFTIEQETVRNNRINLIINSDIDFTHFGWVKQVSVLTGISTQHVNRFMKTYLPDMYKKCFKKKSFPPEVIPQG